MFDRGAEKDLQELLSTLVVASNTAVEIHGFTDSDGTVDGNQRLSEARARAVNEFLERKAAGNFPQNRVQVFAHGQAMPVAPNTTAAGKAQNRRVEIVLKAVH